MPARLWQVWGNMKFDLLPDFTRPAHANPQRRTLTRAIPPGVPEATITAAFALLVASYSGETDDAPPHGNLTVQFTDASVSCEYDPQVHRSTTITALLEHFENLLTQVRERPGGKLSDFSFLSPAEEQLLLTGWNATQSDYPRTLCIHELLEHTARQTPDAIAVQFQEHKLTFAELEGRANQLANYLAMRGAGPGKIIGISLHRSLEMVIAVLAVLKTGAAYLPLDPAFPRARLEFMASDAAIELLVTTQHSTVVTTAHKVFLDAEEAMVQRAPSSPLDRKIDAESRAYVLYTSGSTGTPKGVEVEHRSVVNLLYAMQAHVQLPRDGSLLAVTTLSFDIAVLELFLPLLTGARIILATREQSSDPSALRDLIHQTKPSLMQATPGTWRMLIDCGWNGSRQMKVLVGGEKVSPEIASALVDRCAAAWNCYGPTETTVWSTVCRLERGATRVSIGRPLANTTLYVLDRYGKLAPIGARGELFIGGDGVARGYLNRPDLTAGRFIPNPFGAGRLYRTGDFVRYLPDGQLEILGRNDAQVKIRGFRIELGDVENALEACPQVRAAAVVVRQDAFGENTLAGYFVPCPGSPLDPAAVRSLLAQTLPDYMIPAFLTPMATLPKTPNGKVDRKALPAPETFSVPGRSAINTLETTLVGIWESTLGVRPIGVTDNFFELGGHSVLAARIFARMEKVLGKTLPLATLFQAPTIEKLAAVIRKSDWKPMWSSLVPIRPGGTKPPFFFVHPIGGNVLNFSGFCSHFGADQPIYGLQARGLDNEVAPHTSVEEMAADYIDDIRRVQPEGPYFIGGFSAGGVVAFEMARQLQDMAQPVGILALLDTEILTLVQHHISVDERLHAWWRMTKLNLRYASRMSLAEYVGKKVFNLRMRSKLLAWGLRERMGLPIDPAQLNAEEAFLLAFKRYVPRVHYGNATLFRAGNGAEYLDPKLGWAGLIRGRLDIQEVSGDHDTILQEPHIGMLARLLETCLERARSEEPHSALVPPSAVASERIPGLTTAILGSQEVAG